MLTRLTYSCLALLLLGVAGANVHAQDKKPAFEIGVHYTGLHVTEKGDSDSGPGVRFTYNLNDYLAVEAEGNVLPQTREGGGNNETQGFFGTRVGIRKTRYGLFAKVCPGFTRFYLLGVTPGPNAFEQAHTRFALDAGGVFEYYPTRSTAIRFDAGDTMIQYRPGDFFYRRLDEPMPVSKRFSHNLQIYRLALVTGFEVNGLMKPIKQPRQNCLKYYNYRLSTPRYLLGPRASRPQQCAMFNS